MLLKEKFFRVLLEAYPRFAGHQAPDGRMLDAQGKYTVYNQYAGYYFAWLYTYRHDENPYYMDGATLERAILTWDFYHSQVTDCGLTRIVTMDQYWSDHFEEWGFYHWMNTIELLADHLPAEKLASWNDAIHRIAAQFVRTIENPEPGGNFDASNFEHHVANHFMWSVLAYYRYGMIYGDADACARAKAIMDSMLDYQLPIGSWLEHDTVVVRYSDISLNAVSLFEHYSGDAQALAAVRRGFDFVLNTTYPDFTRIECFDGRNRYERTISLHTGPTFYKCAGGAAYLSKWIGRHGESPDLGDQLMGLVFAADIAAALPEDIPFDDAGIETYIAQAAEMPRIKGCVLKKAGFTVPMCCMEQRTFDNRWILYRQNLISVFHEKTGLLIGGGHSISQPQLSCFNVVSGGKLYYMHEDGELLADGGMALTYGGRRCSIEVSELPDSGISIAYAVEGLDEVERAYVNIPLFGHIGSRIEIGAGALEWGRESIARDIAAGETVCLHGAVMTLSEHGVFQYPVLPFNSYLKQQQRDFKSVLGVITVELDYLRPMCKVEIRA